MSYRLLWGDLHNHNEVGLFHYASGSLERSIEIAQSHLDFFAFTGHAQWFDMPEMPGDKHQEWQEGFDYHRRQWDKTCRLMAEANEKGNFVAFPGYEWHTAKYGDRAVIYKDDYPELLLTDDIRELQQHAKKNNALLLPHMIGYKSKLPGRGIDWEYYDEEIAPVIEIYSEHGCCERDRGPYPYIRHSNGGRTTKNTLQYAWANGFHAGVVANTDQHLGYPGAYGEGMTAVYATDNTREDIWDAIYSRRTYGVTGDRIELQFKINGAPMGSILPGTDERLLEVSFEGWDDVKMVEVLKNNRVIERYFPEDHSCQNFDWSSPFKCRVEYGWGPWSNLDTPRKADWLFNLRYKGSGKIRRYMPCFQSGPFDEQRRNLIKEFKESLCRWQSYTGREGSFAEKPTNAVVFEMEGSPDDVIQLELEQPCRKKINLSLAQLAESSQIEFTGSFPAESVLIHRLYPEARYTGEFNVKDRPSTTERKEDFYYVRVIQENGHMAWSSPIWVEN